MAVVREQDKSRAGSCRVGCVERHVDNAVSLEKFASQFKVSMQCKTQPGAEAGYCPIRCWAAARMEGGITRAKVTVAEKKLHPRLIAAI